MKKERKLTKEKSNDNINHQPSFYIIKDEVFENLKESIKELLESKYPSKKTSNKLHC